MTVPTVASALADARRRGIASLDAQLMLARLLEVPRTRLIARDDLQLPPLVLSRWTDWAARRARGEPLAYLFGEKEFRGLMLEVGPGVLVPRPETELLVDWALELLPLLGPSPRVVDLGTGSGAIAIAVKLACPIAQVTATDASPEALDVARRNAARLAADIEFLPASWWDGLDGRRFDLVLSNPPYVREGDPALADLSHEPRSALVAGDDGLSDLGAITQGAALHLPPGGWVLLEHGFDQAEAVGALLGDAGLSGIALRRDLAGWPRVTGGRNMPDRGHGR